jgi:hypothetical protein
MELADLHKKIDGSLKRLAADLESGLSESLTAYLKALAHFHHYSFGNVMLITAQRPDARHVAGFATWRTKFGRVVKRGERGIAILAPLVRRRAADSPAGSEIEDKGVTVGFRAAHVFDICQTEGEPFPERPTTHGDPGVFTERLKDHTRSLGIELRFEPLPMGVYGASCGGSIILSPYLPPAEEFSVLSHELAHELMHRKDRRKDTSRTVRETEAEAVAFVVVTAVGLDGGTASSDYIKLYRGGPDTLAESLGLIQGAAAAILAGILPNLRQP